MNNLNNIEQYAVDNMEIVEQTTDYCLLIETRTYNWWIEYSVYADKVIVVEMDTNCALVEQSRKEVSTIEDAFRLSSTWC